MIGAIAGLIWALVVVSRTTAAAGNPVTSTEIRRT
jgi:hypothetical protein